jgi:hypothetical protein
MDAVFNSLRADALQWLPEHGIGYFPVAAMPYDESYFDKYVSYEAQPSGPAITNARIAFVARHFAGTLLDVGIGSGHFVRSRPDTFGYDVNPRGLQWLHDRKVYRDLYTGLHDAATFWDSLEHIPSPGDALARVQGFVFVSIPIFESVEHVLRSKHFRKDEHFWYFTATGFVRWMFLNGFELVEYSRFECELGREDIGSFAFRRFGRRSDP